MSLPIKRLGRYKNGANRQRATKFAEKLKDPNFLKGLLKPSFTKGVKP